jgi:proteasome lid subunit RPN8/RPN11
MEGWHLSHVARKFERLLETYRREAGRRWSGIELERATGGVVTRSYVTNLRKGRIENPGMDKLAASAAAMILAHNHPSGSVEPSREDRAASLGGWSRLASPWASRF